MYFGIILHAKWICFPDPFRAVQIWVKVTIAETQSSAIIEAGNKRYEILHYIRSSMHSGSILGAKWICFPDPFRGVRIRAKVTIAETQSSALIEAGNERYEILQH